MKPNRPALPIWKILWVLIALEAAVSVNAGTLRPFTDAKQVAMNSASTCVLNKTGTVRCGGGFTYRLEDRPYGATNPSVVVDGLAMGVNAVAVGGSHRCALMETGAVKCWGENQYGQNGNGTTGHDSVVTQVVGLNNSVSKISTGSSHSCALTNEGAVKCWGLNSSAQLGDSTTVNRSTPVAVLGLDSKVTAITAGYDFTCALTNTGGVKCWGANDVSQLGDGTQLRRNTPIDVSSLSTGVSDISAGWRHACALRLDGSVQCWGANNAGQLGDRTTTNQSKPVSVLGLDSAVVAIATGRAHSCALLRSGAVKCWGNNTDGQLGDGTQLQRSGAVAVVNLDIDVVAIAAGYDGSCAIGSNGQVRCWGNNSANMLLGDSNPLDMQTPVGLAGAATEVHSGRYHTCALIGSGVKCWGQNSRGQLGDGTNVDRFTPVDVAGLNSGVSAIAAWGLNSCALTTVGGVKCWGFGGSRVGTAPNGDVGDGTGQDRSYPTDVVSLQSGVKAIANFGEDLCAFLQNGALKCWGVLPYDITGLTADATGFVSGTNFACAIDVGGIAKCWGYSGYGQLGITPLDAYTTDKGYTKSASVVRGLEAGTKSLAAGDNYACAITRDNDVKCWGRGTWGQLGNGNFDHADTAQTVQGLTNVTALAANSKNVCALVNDGTVRCWGMNADGELGDGTATNSSAPVQVIGLDKPVKSISRINASAFGSELPGGTCAKQIDDRVKCWGRIARSRTAVDTDGLIGVAMPYADNCGLLKDDNARSGTVQCWGSNEYGQWGKGVTSNAQLIPSPANYLLASKNADIASLVLEGITLDKPFKPSVKSYQAIDTNSFAFNVEAKLSDWGAKVAISATGGIIYAQSSGPSVVGLKVGKNLIDFVVTAEDRETSQQYSIAVTRLALPTSGEFVVPQGEQATLTSIGKVTLQYNSSLNIASDSSVVGSTITIVTGNPDYSIFMPGSGLPSGFVTLNTAGQSLQLLAARLSYPITLASANLTTGLQILPRLLDIPTSDSQGLFISAPANANMLIVGEHAVGAGLIASNYLANSPTVVTAGNQGSMIRAFLSPATSADPAGTTIEVWRGSVYLPCSTRCAPGQKSIEVLAGENATFDVAGNLIQVRVGYLPLNNNLSTTLGNKITSLWRRLKNTDDVYFTFADLTGTTARLNGDALDTRLNMTLQSILGAPLNIGGGPAKNARRFDFATGGLQVSAIYPMLIDVSRSDGVTILPNGQAEVVTSGIVTRLTPTVANVPSLATFFYLNSAGNMWLQDGGIVLRPHNPSELGPWDSLMPSWIVTSSPNTPAGVVNDVAGRWIHTDGKGQQQILYPAFADFDVLLKVLKGISANAVVQTNLDGTVSVELLGGKYLLIPDAQITTTPAAHANEDWWQVGEKVFLNYRLSKTMVNTTQGFTVH